MLLRKIFPTFLTIIVACFICFSSYAQQDPVNVLQNIADNMIAGLKANKATLKTKPQIVYGLANKFVVPHAALPEMAKHVLPRQTWNHASPRQREAFEREFTTTLIRTYASALTSYRDQTIHFYPPRGRSSSTIEINSEITGSSMQPVHVSYRLIQANGSWKLFDLSVEGISMLESFRSQFADILSQGNMELLLQRMAGHNRR